ncbi:hypothetical protein TNCV_376981 [Trichonephila clavipes]|nr:hypothetical protein TNCV_376981 [Trichonephila clavipes]
MNRGCYSAGEDSYSQKDTFKRLKKPRCRIRVRYEQLSKFERGHIIGLKDAGFGQIGESLFMRVEAMRSLEDAGKNGWTVVDISAMMVVINLGPHKIERTQIDSQISCLSA